MAKQRYVSVNQAIGRSGYAQKIIDYLGNKKNEKTIQGMVLKLSGLIQNLELVKKTLEQDENRNRRIEYLARFAGDVNSQLSNQLNNSHRYQHTISQTATAQQLIKEIFLLEHKILDKLTGDATKTAEYVIYYNGKNKGEVRRGTISAKHLYESDALAVDAQGNVILKQTVTQLNKFKEYSVTKNGQKNPIDLAKVPEYQEIAKIITAYFTSISEQYQDILKQAKAAHLGFSRDRMHDALRQVNSEGESVEKYMRNVYARYINALTAGETNVTISGLLNRGHLVEAYERLLRHKKSTDGDSPSYVYFLSKSLGNDPWYIGGDIDNVQVKSFLDNASSRQVASLNSIIELGRRLMQLVTKYEKTIAGIQKYAPRVAKEIDKDGVIQNKIDNFYEEEVNALVKEFTQMLTG